MTRVERRSLLGRRRPEAGGGSRLVVALRVTAALVLTGLAGLVVAALAPQAVGLSAHVVTSGSMAPRVQPGDVVLTEPTTAAELRPGQVLLVADPSRPGGLLLHRLVSFDAAGDLVTRGDANQSDDSMHVLPSAVRGVARVRVPWVGLPAVWRAEGRFGLIAVAAGLLAAAAVFVHAGRRRDRAVAQAVVPQPGSTAGSAPPMTGARRPAVRPAAVRPGTGAAHDTAVIAYPGSARVARAAEEKRGSASSAGYSLPPVPPVPARPGSRPPGRPGPGGTGPREPGPARTGGTAGRRHRAGGDHSGCFDGGRFCGQPRR
jgi:signal peptidase